MDQWAEAATAKFLEVSGGRAIAADAVGLRAVALLAVGTRRRLSCVDRGRAGDARVRPRGQPSDAWGRVQAGGRQALRLKTEEYVAEFAAVRQGSTGGPQMVDTHRPGPSACGVAGRSRRRRSNGLQALKAENQTWPCGPEVLTALEACRERPRAGEPWRQRRRYLADGPRRRAPAAVADRALQIGDTAKAAGYFRPSECVGPFPPGGRRLGDGSGRSPFSATAPRSEPVLAAALRAQVRASR